MIHIGVIGLGVMGKNLVLNLVDNGYAVHIFNRTVSKAYELQETSDKIFPFETLESFVTSLVSPRKILLMVSAGKVVDEYLERLNNLLDVSDIVVDGGNSDYNETIRRYMSFRFNIVGCGISGGEVGARYGPSIMVGCKESVYPQIKDFLETISAKYESKPCCAWLGSDGAGHFVKAVHNGIEYCEMQLLQELYNISSSRQFLSNIYKELVNGRCASYLVEICQKILTSKNENGFLLEQIEDKAEQKGTGKFCVQAALNSNTDASFISISVFSRFQSHSKQRRVNFHNVAPEKPKMLNFDLPIDTVEKAFYLAKALCYIQGIDLLMDNKDRYKWQYNIPQICDVWRNGCILRSKFLDVLKEIGRDKNPECSKKFLEIFNECHSSLKQFCKYVIDNDLYCPLFTSCLTWINGLQMNENNGTLIQAMRDFFGKHGVVFKSGKSGSIDWNSML
ncbi:hypothetical protein GINT2_000837 [Glugoides intestinalis]